MSFTSKAGFFIAVVYKSKQMSDQKFTKKGKIVELIL